MNFWGEGPGTLEKEGCIKKMSSKFAEKFTGNFPKVPPGQSIKFTPNPLCRNNGALRGDEPTASTTHITPTTVRSSPQKPKNVAITTPRLVPSKRLKIGMKTRSYSGKEEERDGTRGGFQSEVGLSHSFDFLTCSVFMCLVLLCFSY